jgi:cysteinyl-tRNA synthetase
MSQAACGCGQPHQHSDGSSGSRGDGAAAAPDVFVRYWLHNGFVNVDSEKMSKSLGNFFTIRDVLQAYHPAALRWFLVSSQYRAPLNYTQHGLEEASDRVFYIYETLASVAHALAAAGEAGAAAAAAADNAVSLQAAAAALAAGGGGSSADSSSKAAGKGGGKGGAAAAEAAALAVGGEVVAGVVAGLLDDLNTPGCVAALSGPLKAINDLLSTKAGRKHPQRLQLLASHQAGLLASLDMLGLAPPDLAATLGELRRLALARAQTNEAEVGVSFCAERVSTEGRALVASLACGRCLRPRVSATLARMTAPHT